MSTETSFHALARATQSELERTVSALRSLVDALHSAIPVDAAEAESCLQRALQQSAEIRRLLEHTAREHGLPLPAWTDGAGLDRAIGTLSEQVAALQEVPRQRLQQLSADLGQGEVVHRRPGRQRDLEQLREEARAEAARASEAVHPPTLPGDDPCWLDWWWRQDGLAQETILENLSPDLPVLRRFLDLIEVEHWRRILPTPAVPPAIEALPAPDVVESTPSPSIDLARPEDGLGIDLARPEDGLGIDLARPEDGLGAQPEAVGGSQKPVWPSRLAGEEEGGGVSAEADANGVAPAKVALIAEAAPPPAPVIPAPPVSPTALLVHASEATRAVPPPVPKERPELLPELRSFDEFQRRCWIAPSGECQPAPWADAPGFLLQVRKHLGKALVHNSFRRAYLFAAAAGRLDPSGTQPRPADVACLAALWAHPLDFSAGLDEQRNAFLIAGAGVDGGARSRLALFLETLRPWRERVLTHEEIDLLIETVQYQTGSLAHVVRSLLQAASQCIDPIPRLRDAFREKTLEGLEVLQRQLLGKRVDLHHTVTFLWMAGGGAIQRTHCRQAWDDFIQIVKPVVEDLYPEAHHGKPDWDVEAIRQRIAQFVPAQQRLADKYGVKYQDRRASDRAAARIAQAASEVNEVMEQVHRATGRRGGHDVFHFPLDAVRALRKSGPLPDPVEECCRLLLLRHLEDFPLLDGENGDLLELTLDDLIDYPELLALADHRSRPRVRDGALDTPPPRASTSAALHVSDIQDPIKASAVLFTEGPRRSAAEEPSALLLRRLRQHPDPELLCRAAALVELPGEEPESVPDARIERMDELRNLRARFARFRQTLESLAFDPEPLLAIETNMDQFLDNSGGASDLLLRREWFRRVVEFAEQRQAWEVECWRQRTLAETEGERREAILSAIKSQHYSMILPLLLGDGPTPIDRGCASVAGVRQTCWRHEVETRFGKPDAAARKLKRLADPVAAEWKPVTGQVAHADRPVRTAFARFVFSDEPADIDLARGVLARAEHGLGGGAALYQQGENDAHFFAIETHLLRRRLAAPYPTPSFFPQFGRFARLVLLTPPAPVGSTDFKKRLGNLLAQHKQDLCVVLAPQVSAAVRRNAREWLQDQHAALLDDYDLCRLLNPGGARPDPLLGLLEIVFEQQRWKNLSPFVASDTSLARKMFVGRRNEARAIAVEGKFSRLFAGRKMGKSALLRFIQETYEGARLPSGRLLRVLLVPAAGLASESSLVDAVLESLHRNLAFAPGKTPGESTSDHLVRVLDRYPQEHPEESLLILLDEADAFVEEQACEYARDNKECLSGKIAVQSANRLDEHGLPRVRLFYSGHRATHTLEGPWSGSGEVLRLEPLPLEDAAALIAGPLARLGVDAAQEAISIAHRCGCQPAVLIRFGECLLENLDRVFLKVNRDRQPLVVTPEQVAEAFNDPRVQEEIVSVTDGSFAGNERGFVVFAAVLLEFAARGPGAVLEDAEQAVLERLKTLSIDLLPLAKEERGSVLSAEFRDLVRLRLLVQRGSEERPAYALGFPHHLPILLRKDLFGEVERRRQMRQAEAEETSRALLPPGQVHDLQMLLFDGDYPIQAAVVCSLWPDAVEKSPGSVPDRLGVASDIRIAADSPLLEERCSAPLLVVAGVGPEHAQRVLAIRGRGLPPPLFLGGIDLLRWALRQTRREEAGLEVCGVGRLSPGVLRSWFTRVRGFAFDVPEALEIIRERTSGMPLLVEVFDRLLLGGEYTTGTTVSRQRFAEVVEQFDRELVRVTATLLSGKPACRLEPREVDLLRMLATVCQENPHAVGDLPVQLTTEWELYQEACPVKAFDPDSDDVLALEVLLKLGLAPVRIDPSAKGPLELLGALSPDDALGRLLQGMGLPT